MKAMLPLLGLILALSLTPSSLAQEDLVHDNAYILEREDSAGGLETVLNTYLERKGVAIMLETWEDAAVSGDPVEFAKERFNELELNIKYKTGHNLLVLFVLNTGTEGTWDNQGSDHKLIVVHYRETELPVISIERVVDSAVENYDDYFDSVLDMYVDYDRWFISLVHGLEGVVSDNLGDDEGDGNDGDGPQYGDSGDSGGSFLDYYCHRGGSYTNVFCGARASPENGGFVLKEYSVINTIGAISICDPDPPMQEKIREWILTNPKMREQVLSFIDTRYDNAVSKIFDNVKGMASRSTRGSSGTCEGITADELLENPDQYGAVCNHWSALLFSLIRTLGVPSERAYIASYGTEELRAPGSPFESNSFNGHTVVLYRSDSGEWWVMDTTCCRNWYKADDFDGRCGGGSCEPHCTLVLYNDNTPQSRWAWRDSSRLGGFLGDKEYCYV